MPMYKVLVSSSRQELERQVNEDLRAKVGWIPLGGVDAVWAPLGMKYYQAMITNDESFSEEITKNK